jgi:hypothetical protein
VRPPARTRQAVQRRRPPVPGRAALAAVAVLALAATPARADQAPAFTAGPTIAGEALVGAPLRVVAQWSGQPAPLPLYEWERCDATGLTCEPVTGACGATHTLTFDDFGQRLMARVDLWNVAGAATARTPLSDLVIGLSAPPAAGPPASQGCAPSAQPPATSPSAAPPPPPAPTGRGVARAAYLQPFPVVRIRGHSVDGGMRITMLSVRGPRSASVRARCAGEGCPRRNALGPFALPARLRGFERVLRAGTVLKLRVSAGTAIGKYTSFRIRARGAPRRVDRCLLPGRWAPARCPAP